MDEWTLQEAVTAFYLSKKRLSCGLYCDTYSWSMNRVLIVQSIIED